MFELGRCLARISIRVITCRRLYGVVHNPNRQIFYVKVNNKDRAVLLYKRDKDVMDMQTINVPREHQGRGFARLLAEAALTYAIVHNYRLILSCEYMQKYYLATRTPELEARVIGPKSILEGPGSKSLDPDTIHELPDPQDAVTTNSKN